MRKYKIVYSDPPWHYNSRCQWSKTRFGGGVDAQYPTMKTPDICRLGTGLARITDQNCALFLWATFPNIKDALKVMEEWGFEYKTLGFLWVKTNSKSGTPFFGTGFYTKSNPEACLLGIRGKMTPISNAISNTVMTPIERHSKKPILIRDQIVELFGDIPRLELFAREKAEGWDATGLECDGLDIRDFLKEGS